MAVIELSNGNLAMVDDEDYQSINRLHWYKSGDVAVASFFSSVGMVVVSMPRFLLGLKTGDKRVVIHSNGNKLDCRRSNIKIKTRADVMSASKIKTNNKSGYRGVSELSNGSWRAQIASHGAQHYIGTFKTAKDASAAYKEAEKEMAKLRKARNEIDKKTLHNSKN